MVLVSKRSSSVTFQMNVEIILMKSLVAIIWHAATLKKTFVPGNSKLMMNSTGLERMAQPYPTGLVPLEITPWVSLQVGVQSLTLSLSKAASMKK